MLGWKHLVGINICWISGFVSPGTVGFIWEHKKGNSCEILGSVCAHMDDLKGQVEIHPFFFPWFFLYFFPFSLKHLHPQSKGELKSTCLTHF